MKFIGKPETTGDITGVDLTGNAPIEISSETGTTSGNYSATIGVGAASTSNRGVVELATTAETTTGTDTARAVTPDGLKDGYQGSNNVTTLGTIGTGVWNGTAIGGSYISATQPNIDSIGTDGDMLSILGDTLSMTNTTASKPAMTLTNQTDDGTAPIITLKNQRVDGTTQAGENNDYLGKIFFQGYDDQGSGSGVQNYASITSQIHDATSGQESGHLNLQVANHDGGLETGLRLTGGSNNSEIDVTLGLGAASIVTVPGHIDLAGDIDVDGTLEADAITVAGTALTSVCSPVAGHASIATVGTIGTGVWQGTAIAHAYIGTDAIETDNIADAQVTVAKLHADAIQTSGESFADNDTSLMTSAAIDDKINTKYSTSYITFSAKSTSSYGTNYVMIHANGISESTFSTDSSVDSAGDFGGVTTEEGGSGTDATATVASANLEQQIPIPETCKLIGFYATTTTSTNTGAAYDTGVAIWHVPESGVNWGSSTASTATLIHKSDSSRHTEGSNRKKVQKVERMDGTAKTLGAGDILIPSVFGETADQQIMATITLVIATPIKTI